MLRGVKRLFETGHSDALEAGKPSKLNAEKRVPTIPIVTSADTTEGDPLVDQHCTLLADVHADVPHALPSIRALAVLSLVPKSSPDTVTLPAMVRP